MIPKLTHGEEHVLLVLARWGEMTAANMALFWTTETLASWATPKLKVLRDLGLVRTDKSRRPWHHSLTEAGEAEARRRRGEA